VRIVRTVGRGTPRQSVERYAAKDSFEAAVGVHIPADSPVEGLAEAAGADTQQAERVGCIQAGLGERQAGYMRE